MAARAGKQSPGDSEPAPARPRWPSPLARRVSARGSRHRRRGACRALPARMGFRRLEPGRPQRSLRAFLSHVGGAQPHQQPSSQCRPDARLCASRRHPGGRAPDGRSLKRSPERGDRGSGGRARRQRHHYSRARTAARSSVMWTARTTVAAGVIVASVHAGAVTPRVERPERRGGGEPGASATPRKAATANIRKRGPCRAE
jgi:hypothetical protein